MPPVTPTPDEARRLLLDELARREYATGESLLMRFLNWLWDTLSGITGLTPPSWQLLALGLGVVAVVLLLAWRVAGPVRLARRHRAGVVFSADDARSALAFRAEADVLAGRQDWSGAVVALFRAIIRGGQERLLLADRDGQTAREAADALGAAFPTFRGELDWAAGWFEAILYGDGQTRKARQARQTDFLRMRRLDTELAAARPNRVNHGLLPVVPDDSFRPPDTSDISDPQSQPSSLLGAGK